MEVSGDRDTAGTGRPHAERHAATRLGVRAEQLPQLAVVALTEQVQVDRANHREGLYMSDIGLLA